MNATKLLKQQHAKTKKVLETLAKSGGSTAEIDTLANELVAHMVIEEHVFYPRIRELLPSMVEESFEEHAVARFELARLIEAGGNAKQTRALVLKELLEHHIEEEEEEMFEKVERDVAEEELARLGEKMESMFERAVEKGYAAFFQSHPSRQRRSNQRPPANGTAHAR